MRRPSWAACTWKRCGTRSTTITTSPTAICAGVKGYEFYAKLEKTYSKLQADNEAKAKAIEFFRSLHAAGTPAQVLEKLRYIHQTVPLEHVIGTFAFGGLPYPKLEKSFKLFAEKVLPVLKNDPAFEYPKELGSTAQAPASK